MIEILIVEDNQFAQLALLDKLSAFNDINVKHTAANGQLGVDFLAGQSVHLVLMDIEMPIMNGIDATAIIKQKYPNIKVVMITVYDDDDYIFNSYSRWHSGGAGIGRGGLSSYGSVAFFLYDRDFP